MKNSTSFREYLKISALLSGVLVLVISCGGGGGGGISALTYTGLITPAVITDANKEELVKTALGSADVATINPVGVSVSPSPSPSHFTALPALLTALARAGGKLDISNMDAPPLSAAGLVMEYDETIDGQCGGTMRITGTADDTTGEFDVSLSMKNYDDCYGVLNGQARMSGTFDQNDEPVSYIYTFDQLSFSDRTVSVTASGSIQIDINTDGSLDATSKMVYRNNDSGKIYRIDYTMSITIEALGGAMTTSGRFYHPDYGYVEVNTLLPVTTSLFDDYPLSGQVLLTGGPGSIGPTRARVTYQRGGDYILDADLDGDGSYESSESCNWETGCSPLVI